MYKIRRTLYGMGLWVVLGWAPTSAAAENKPPEDLLRDLAPPQSSPDAAFSSEEAPEPIPAKVKGGRDHPVAVDIQKLQADRIKLNLFDDATFVAERDRIVEHGQGRSVWIGHLQGEPDSEVVLAIRDQILAGTVKRDNGDLYEIIYRENGRHRVRQLDHAKTPLHPHPVSVGPKLSNSTKLSFDSNPPVLAAASINTTIVDLMVVYTPKARINAGGITAIKARIDNAIAAANQAYLNSRVDMRLRLVSTAEVPYTETGNMLQTLYDLQGSRDGKMDIVHQWRNQYGADQVALVSADANYCGISYQMTKLAYTFAPYAFAVVHDDSRYACLANQTLAHELGHNQGNSHDRANSSAPGIYSYSYGYRLCQTGGFRTVMAYPCAGANLISYFANPSIALNGTAIGIDPNKDAVNSAADSWSMTNARATIASWRSTKTTAGAVTVAAAPNAPGYLAASPIAADQIILEWADTSDNEAGFRIEHSLDGTEWKEIANLGPNITRFSHTGLSPATQYAYRVTAYNGVGGSDSTNVASAATPAPVLQSRLDALPPAVKIGRPGEGTKIGDQVGIVATASDNGEIQSVKLYIDGRLKAATYAEILTYRWNAQSVPPGVHTIDAVATDASGNSGRASIQVRK